MEVTEEKSLEVPEIASVGDYAVYILNFIKSGENSDTSYHFSIERDPFANSVNFKIHHDKEPSEDLLNVFKQPSVKEFLEFYNITKVYWEASFGIHTKPIDICSDPEIEIRIRRKKRIAEIKLELSKFSVAKKVIDQIKLPKKTTLKSNFIVSKTVKHDGHT